MINFRQTALCLPIWPSFYCARTQLPLLPIKASSLPLLPSSARRPVAALPRCRRSPLHALPPAELIFSSIVSSPKLYTARTRERRPSDVQLPSASRLSESALLRRPRTAISYFLPTLCKDSSRTPRTELKNPLRPTLIPFTCGVINFLLGYFR